ncbi:MAG: tetratricopeptide repeat protein [Hyphomicrobiales bacterium]
MQYILGTLLSFALALALPLGAHAQETSPPVEAPNTNDIQKKLVAELEALRNEIALAHHEDKLIEREKLYAILKTAKSEPGGKYVADALWKNWIASAPTPEVADLVSQAMERRRWYDYEGARVILNKIVETAPNYSEGWNQRAYILFLQEKFDEALDDIEKALALEPRHFAALSGKARILFHQGRAELAQQALQSAVEIHPWIYERYLLTSPKKPGQEPAENRTGTKL